jgi:tight adherence protein C
MSAAGLRIGFSAAGALVGLMAGAGCWLILGGVPWRRGPTLEERLVPYLHEIRPGVRTAWPRRRAPWDVLGWLFGPFAVVSLHWVERISGGPVAVRRRLDQLGGRQSLEQFRAEQVLAGVLGAVAGAGVALLTALGRGFSPIPVVGLVVVGALLGVLGRDQVLSRQVRRREERILAEFPAVAELLALSVGAGEGPMGALERVARVSGGELAAELRRTLADARTGLSFVEALEGLATRTTLPSLARFVDGVAVAVDRGTPLADVLRAQAQDVRELTRRRLMESGGRKEIAMMVPVVFLILPVTVLFAVYPGLAVLNLDL